MTVEIARITADWLAPESTDAAAASFDVARVTPEWLALREPADAAARSVALVDRVAPRLPAVGPLVVHDLGGGSGGMGRWLARRLRGPQHWIVHDRDADLFEAALANPPSSAADGAAVTVETRSSDITRLAPDDLADARLITASALLDMLTADELRAMVGAGAAVGCPILIALTVVGRVVLTPADPLDAHIAAAFDAHQRRTTPAGRLLGPDAVAEAVAQLRETGVEVLLRPSPWRLGAGHAALTAEWLAGWVGAACEQEPSLAEDADPYLERRMAEVWAGELRVMVDHADLLVLP